jgi:type I restriction enzyme S subunit
MIESNFTQDISALKRLPKSWSVFDFGDVFIDISGGNKKFLKSAFLVEGRVAVVDQGKDLIAGFTNEEDEVVKGQPPYIVFGDHTRIFKFIDFPFVMGADGTKVFKVKDITINNEKYLYHFLNSLNIPNTGYNRHFKYLKSTKIPFPPLPQQQKIASILDAADALRQNDKALIAKYDELTQALFLDMFGDVRKNEKRWKQSVLGKLCEVGSSRRVFVDELVEDGIPFYRGTEIGHMSLNEDTKPTLFITEFHYENLKRETGVPKIGDLLMPSICPDGRIFEVSDGKPFYFKDGRVLWIKVNNLKINSVYLKKHLKAIFAVDYAKIASGTTFAELKIFALKKLILHYPPLDLQNQFAERVSVIEEQKAIAQKSLEKSESLFNSLLQKAFKGEIG